ncbi:hypothetical protein CFC21_012723 [Triticum aestivum]|uniref:Uncharacterized protein n=2 Tax=Triticum aestivum TaxID=4565 RepID=A0A9R1IXM8_WHEAT|nr:hypothetical protein CFC21_012723 [Triticum aestivum]
MENCIFGICNNAMGERRELNPRMVDSQSTALIHLATSAPYPAKGFFYLFSIDHYYIGHRMPLFKKEKRSNQF